MTRCQALILAVGLIVGGIGAAWGPPGVHESDSQIASLPLPALTLEDGAPEDVTRGDTPLPPVASRPQKRIRILDV